MREDEVKNLYEDCKECNMQLIRMYESKAKAEDTLNAITESMDPMMWIKDLNGKYIFANDRLIHGLLLAGGKENVLGKTDLEIAEYVRSLPDVDRHTVGAICADSDQIVLKNGRAMRFTEQFLVDSANVVLDVRKNVWRNALGHVIGTKGIAIDITEKFVKLNALIHQEDIPQKYRDCIQDVLYKDYLKAENE